MPTGYTATLCEKEQPFSEFVMGCARAMGACVMMRDDPFDAPIPERFEPSDYHTKKVAEAEQALASLDASSDDELSAEAAAYYHRRVRELRDRISKNIKTTYRLNLMLAEVEGWLPPTPDHIGLKDFMRQQLRSTIDFDGNSEWEEKELSSLRPMTAREWRQKESDRLLKEIEYHTKGHADEVERTEARNAWIKALRESLQQPAKGA